MQESEGVKTDLNAWGQPSPTKRFRRVVLVETSVRVQDSKVEHEKVLHYLVKVRPFFPSGAL